MHRAPITLQSLRNLPPGCCKRVTAPPCERRYCAEHFKERLTCSAVGFSERLKMRLAAVALSAVAVVVALASAAEAQQRRQYRDQTERITIIDENGRVRT